MNAQLDFGRTSQRIMGLSAQALQALIRDGKAVAALQRFDPLDVAELADLDRLAAMIPAHVTPPLGVKLSLVRDGETIAVPMNRFGMVDMPEVWRRYADGATLLLNNVHKLDPRLKEVCENLFFFSGHSIGANLYLTPAGATGFAAHFDTHDVLVAQLSGSKNWTVYERPEGFGRRPMRADGGVVGKALTDKTLFHQSLESGDYLFLPQGVPHEGRTSDASSLHVSLGFKAVDVRAYLLALVDVVFQNDVRLREPISLNLFSSENLTIDLDSCLAPLCDALSNPGSALKALAALRKRVLSEEALAVPYPDAASASTALAWRKEAFWSLSEAQDGHIELGNGQLVVRLNASEEGVVRGLIRGQSYPSEELGGLDVDNARELMRKLSYLGLVKPQAAAA